MYYARRIRWRLRNRKGKKRISRAAKEALGLKFKKDAAGNEVRVGGFPDISRPSAGASDRLPAGHAGGQTWFSNGAANDGDYSDADSGDYSDQSSPANR